MHIDAAGFSALGGLDTSSRRRFARAASPRAASAIDNSSGSHIARTTVRGHRKGWRNLQPFVTLEVGRVDLGEFGHSPAQAHLEVGSRACDNGRYPEQEDTDVAFIPSSHPGLFCPSLGPARGQCQATSAYRHSRHCALCGHLWSRRLGSRFPLGQTGCRWLKRFLALPHVVPSPDTFRRVIERLNPDEFQKAFLAWVQSVNILTQGQVIAIDGKTLRRSHDHVLGQDAIHMVMRLGGCQSSRPRSSQDG